MHKELEPYREYEMADTVEDLFSWRCKLEDATAQLRDLKRELDQELIRRMKEEKIAKFETLYGGEKATIKYGEKKKTKVDARTMTKFLFKGTESAREMALNSLSAGQSAWKASKVQEMADTLGLPEIIQTTFQDEVEVKVIQTEKLKAMGVIK